MHAHVVLCGLWMYRARVPECMLVYIYTYIYRHAFTCQSRFPLCSKCMYRARTPVCVCVCLGEYANP